MTLTSCLTVAAGGAAGCLCRYLVQQLPFLGTDRAWPTLAVNILGCMLIGIVATLIDSRGGWPLLRLLLVTGFLGGFTTYSSFALDAAVMLQSGNVMKAFGYVAVTLVGGFAAFAAGWFMAQRLNGF